MFSVTTIIRPGFSLMVVVLSCVLHFTAKTNNNTAVAAAVPVVAVTWLTSRPPVIGVDGKEYAPGARLFATADRISQDVLILPKF